MPKLISTEILQFYSSVIGCTNTASTCPNTVNDKTAGIPPRGFFTQSQSGKIKILIVGKNPGHVLEDENLLYKGKTPEQIGTAHLGWGNRCFYDPKSFDTKARRSLTFHKNILAYFSYFLDVPESEVFDHCALTDLVKCQTVGEQDLLRPETIQECFSKHFMRELSVLNPKVLVALGNEAFNYLNLDSLKRLHKRFVFKVKHPSYHYRRDLREPILASIKHELRSVLD